MATKTVYKSRAWRGSGVLYSLSKERHKPPCNRDHNCFLPGMLVILLWKCCCAFIFYQSYYWVFWWQFSQIYRARLHNTERSFPPTWSWLCFGSSTYCRLQMGSCLLCSWGETIWTHPSSRIRKVISWAYQKAPNSQVVTCLRTFSEMVEPVVGLYRTESKCRRAVNLDKNGHLYHCFISCSFLWCLILPYHITVS